MTKEIKKESDLLVSIAEKEIRFFVNHLNQPWCCIPFCFIGYISSIIQKIPYFVTANF